MSPAPPRPGPAAPLAAPRPSKTLPYTLRVTLEADVYDALLESANRDFRKLEWQASYLLTKAVRDQAPGAADAA